MCILFLYVFLTGALFVLFIEIIFKPSKNLKAAPNFENYKYQLDSCFHGQKSRVW